VFDVVASALDASSDAALCGLDASPDAALCALDASPSVGAACRFAERQSPCSAPGGSCSAPGPQLWIPLASWTEAPKTVWRVPEWIKSFDEKEFPVHFFRSCREVLFGVSAATTVRRRGNFTAVRREVGWGVRHEWRLNGRTRQDRKAARTGDHHIEAYRAASEVGG
jgi:hypothetical protein